MEDNWIKRAKEEGYNHILIIYDIEDKSNYPVFFISYNDLIRYSENIISEMKCKVVKIINI